MFKNINAGYNDNNGFSKPLLYLTLRGFKFVFNCTDLSLFSMRGYPFHWL